MLKLRSKCSTVSGPRSAHLADVLVGNYQPVRPEVTLSWSFLLITSIALVLLTLLYWISFAFLLFISTGPLEPLYSFTYYWLSSTYCLLASMVTLQRLWKLGQSGPTGLARLGLLMLTVTFIEYLIFSNVLYSRQQVDDLYGNVNKRKHALTFHLFLQLRRLSPSECLHHGVICGTDALRYTRLLPTA